MKTFFIVGFVLSSIIVFWTLSIDELKSKIWNEKTKLIVIIAVTVFTSLLLLLSVYQHFSIKLF